MTDSDAAESEETPGPTGIRRLFLVVGAFLLVMLILGGLALVALRLYLGDPHDLPEAGKVPLKEALRQTGSTLPENAANVHFSSDANPMGTYLELSYDIPCGAVPALMQQEALTVAVPVEGLENHARKFAEENGWRPEFGATVAVNGRGSGFKTAMVQTLPTGTCAVYLAAFNG